MNMSSAERKAEANRLFLDAIFCGNIEKLAHAAYEVFRKPVVILDNAGRVICLVPNKPINYEVWDEWFYQGRVSIKKNLETLRYFDEILEPGKNVAFVDGREREEEIGRGIMIRYYEHSICAGHGGIIVGDNYIPDETDMEIAEIFGKALTHFCSNAGKASAPEIYRNAFLSGLLSGKATASDIEVMDYSLRMTTKENYAVLVCLLSEPYKDNVLGYGLCDNILRHFQHTIPIVFHGRLVVLCSHLTLDESKAPLKAVNLKPVIKYLEGYNLPIAVSCGFDDIRDIHLYYEQALLTVETGLKIKPEKRTYVFEDCAPYQLLFQESAAKIMMHPMISKIRIYDEKNHTEYLKTYKTYILSGRDKKHAARQLSVHVNTLTYRLNIINDLFHSDALSKQEDLHIVLSLLLVDLGL